LKKIWIKVHVCCNIFLNVHFFVYILTFDATFHFRSTLDPEEPDKSDETTGQSGAKLTDEQRQYANDLINRYTLNAERAKRKAAVQESNINRDQNDQWTSDTEDLAAQKLSFEEKAKFVNEILSKYTLECNDEDDKEIADLSSKAKKLSFTSDEERHCSDSSTVKQVIHSVSEADEIIKKYVQRKPTPDAGIVTVN
jgi:cell division protein FtsI/penicillin-binding protein 2